MEKMKGKRPVHDTEKNRHAARRIEARRFGSGCGMCCFRRGGTMGVIAERKGVPWNGYEDRGGVVKSSFFCKHERLGARKEKNLALGTGTEASGER